MLTRLRLLVNALLRRESFEREMASEMRFHINAYADDLVRSGVAREEAERRAHVEFGGLETAREDCRQARGLQLFDELRQDLRYAVRQLARTPGFTTAAIVSLALGIGANTAIFSLMDAVLFRSLQISNPDALYFLAHRSASDTSSSSNYPLFERYKAAEIFDGVTAYLGQTFTIATPDGLERVNGQFVSGNYHAVIGVPIALGRGFSNEPDRPVGQPPIAVISDGYWERKFGRAQDIIGQTLTIEGRPTTVVGVTAPGFRGLVSGMDVDVTLPMAVRALDNPGFLNARDGWNAGDGWTSLSLVGSLSLIGRVKSDVTEAQTLAMADAVFQQFCMEPDNVCAREDNRTATRSGVLLPAGKGSHGLRRQYKTPLRVLMAMVGIVLLIACGNVANLFLARGATRSKEVAVRMSIGAGRGRLIRQFLTESLVLAGIAGVLGLLVAIGSTPAILSFLNVGQSPLVLDGTLNGRVLGFTIGISVLTAVTFGLVPAFRATKVDLTPALKEGGATTHRRRRFAAGKPLVVAQIALCVLVIAAAGLLVRSLWNLRTLDTGFARQNVLLFNIETGNTFTEDGKLSFYTALLERLSGLPGVASVSYTKHSPMDFGGEFRGISIPGFVDAAERRGVTFNIVTPEYFETFGIPLTGGRGFTSQDRAGSTSVALVSESMAREFFGKADPIGRTIVMGLGKAHMTVVGTVGDVRFERLRDNPPAMVYTPLAQPTEAFGGGYPSRLTVVVRGSGDSRSLAGSARELVRGLSSDATVAYVRTMNQQLDAALVRERLLANLSGGYGLLALLLAFVGLYGVMSYSVARRSREIGIRVALGATRGTVLRQVLGETLAISAAGIAIGLTGALMGTKVVSAFLFGLSPRDPATLGAVAAMLVMIALVAGYLPARRAARVEPMRALRAD